MPYAPFLLNGLIATKQLHCLLCAYGQAPPFEGNTLGDRIGVSLVFTTPAPNTLPSTYETLNPWNKRLAHWLTCWSVSSASPAFSPASYSATTGYWPHEGSELGSFIHDWILRFQIGVWPIVSVYSVNTCCISQRRKSSLSLTQVQIQSPTPLPILASILPGGHFSLKTTWEQSLGLFSCII